MDILSSYSRKALVIILLMLGIVCITVNGMFYSIQPRETIGVLFHTDFVVVSSIFFGIMGFLMWLFLRGSLKDSIQAFQNVNKLKSKSAKSESSAQSHADVKLETLKKDKRLFLHLISSLQNEGRLLDFFAENLEQYQDDQIGAAVRGIHENCNKVIKKYFKFKTVVEENEDDEITIAPGFDPFAVKLIGNVTGNPPFKGIVRHRGWKTLKLEMPTLSGVQDPDVISPAEIEIR